MRAPIECSKQVEGVGTAQVYHFWYITGVPTKNPRVNVVLERPLYDALGRLARREGASLSTKARDLLREAIETYEDLGLAAIAEERARTFKGATLSHDETWGRRAKKG